MIAPRQVSVPQGTFASAEIHATVIRCGCGNPQAHAKLNKPCPTPKALELAGDGGLVGRVTASEIGAYTFEREPTLNELLSDLYHATIGRVTAKLRRA